MTYYDNIWHVYLFLFRKKHVVGPPSDDHRHQWKHAQVSSTKREHLPKKSVVKKSLPKEPFVSWSKVAILGMVIPPLIGILIMGVKTPTIGLITCWSPSPINGSLDPGTFETMNHVMIWPRPEPEKGSKTEMIPTFLDLRVFPKIGVPENGWFIVENPIKMEDDLGAHLFLEIPLQNPSIFYLSTEHQTNVNSHVQPSEKFSTRYCTPNFSVNPGSCIQWLVETTAKGQCLEQWHLPARSKGMGWRYDCLENWRS